MLHDEENGNTFTPLHHVPQQQATFDIHNSPLSEAAVVGLSMVITSKIKVTLTYGKLNMATFLICLK